MTTCDIESAFTPGVITLNIPNNEVHVGTEWKILPDLKSAVIIDCSQVQHITSALWSGEATFRLSSPALRNDLDAHASKLKALETWLRDLAAVQESFIGSGFALVGLWVDTVSALEVDGRWHGEITCRIGLQEI